MSYVRKWQKVVTMAMMVLGLGTLGGCMNQGRQVAQGQGQQTSQSGQSASSSSQKSSHHWFGGGYNFEENGAPISIELVKTTLTPSVKKQLGDGKMVYQHGAVIINDNKTNLNTNVSSAPYVQEAHANPAHHNRVEGTARAWLNQSCRQYRSREDTGNGASSWKPVGFHQVTHLKGNYNHLYDRGHLIAYAIAGNVKGFDASEHNPNNVATQTAWSNEAYGGQGYGQNEFEGQVRQALDSGDTVMYTVTPIYNSTKDVVPMGNHLEAKDTEGRLEFNVFVPNIQAPFTIDYTTGFAHR